MAASRSQCPHRAASSSQVMPMIGRPIRSSCATLSVVTPMPAATSPDEIPARPSGMTTFFLMDGLPEAAMTYFYGHLFAAEPEIRGMFPAAMGIQHQRFYQALQSRDEGYLEALGRAHRKFGVRGEHFPAFRAALLATCRQLRLATPAQDAVLATFD